VYLKHFINIIQSNIKVKYISYHRNLYPSKIYLKPELGRKNNQLLFPHNLEFTFWSYLKASKYLKFPSIYIQNFYRAKHALTIESKP
jgi:hypothetical protein